MKGWSRTIKLPDAMSAPETSILFTIIGQDHLRFVGGCVRDALLGRPIGDIDLATPLPPEKIILLCEKAGLKVIPTGIAHGTVTVRSGTRSYEITTLRRDISTDGRHAEVAFSADWHDDAARRDFTINALYADRDGHIYDPLGRGLDDLAAARVVFVGDPETRIREDFLRILRFFRFSQRYANGTLDAAGYKACQQNAKGIARLSRERITAECLKIIDAPTCPPILAAIHRAGLLKGLFAPRYKTERIVSFLSVDRGEAVLLRSVAILYLISGGGRRGLARLGTYLILTRAQKKLYEKIDRAGPGKGRVGQHRLRTWRVEHGDEMARALLALSYAVGRLSAEDHRDLETTGFAEVIPPFPLEASDLMAHGLHGEALGKALAHASRAWVRSGFTKSKTALLARVASVPDTSR